MQVLTALQLRVGDEIEIGGRPAIVADVSVDPKRLVAGVDEAVFKPGDDDATVRRTFRAAHGTAAAVTLRLADGTSVVKSARQEFRVLKRG